MKPAKKAKITFPVSDVTPQTEFKLPLLDYKAAIEFKLRFPVEACAVSERLLFKDQGGHHSLLMALSVGYNCHYPVTISHDMIWLLIGQGFAEHVNLNSEALRDRLVNHREKQTISIRRDDFVKGNPILRSRPKSAGQCGRNLLSKNNILFLTSQIRLPLIDNQSKN